MSESIQQACEKVLGDLAHAFSKNLLEIGHTQELARFSGVQITGGVGPHNFSWRELASDAWQSENRRAWAVFFRVITGGRISNILPFEIEQSDLARAAIAGESMHGSTAVPLELGHFR